MIKAAVLGSPISHSLSPLLHNRAYEILNIEGKYSAIDIEESGLLSFLEDSISQSWKGFNLTMPLKERVFDSSRVRFDQLSTRIRSANTLVRTSNHYEATSTDALAFARLLADFPLDKVAVIGGGGTARAATAAISSRAKSIDFFLRTASRVDMLKSIAPEASIGVLDFDAPLKSYDVIINTTPAGVADVFAQRIEDAEGLYFESLYHPWPTELAFAWSELGGSTLNGVDLLVEQALDAISLMTQLSFDYTVMRAELVRVAIAEISPQV